MPKSRTKSYSIDLTLPFIAGTLFMAGIKLFVAPSLSWWTVTFLLWIIPAFVFTLLGAIALVWMVVTLIVIASGRKPKLVYKWERKPKVLTRRR